jgi:hypothetical protein
MRHPTLLLFLALAASPALAAPGAPVPAKSGAPAVSVAPTSVSTAPPASTLGPTSPRKVVLPSQAPNAEQVKLAIPRARVQLPKFLRNPDGTLNVKRRVAKDGRPSWWRRMRLLIENPAALKQG